MADADIVGLQEQLAEIQRENELLEMENMLFQLNAARVLTEATEEVSPFFAFCDFVQRSRSPLCSNKKQPRPDFVFWITFIAQQEKLQS